jgi:GDP-D-mannose dehydratase
VHLLIGDSKKSKTKLGGELKYDMAGLVKGMVEENLTLLNIHLVQ